MNGKIVSRVVLRVELYYEGGDRIGIDQVATAEQLTQNLLGPLAALAALLEQLWRKLSFEIGDARFPAK